MKVYITTDHAAFEKKEMLKEYLSQKHEVIDLGHTGTESVHYPDFGKKIAKAVLESGEFGIALCGSGIGINIQVNRFKGIRGALCASADLARLSRTHNDANILCLAGRFHTDKELQEMADIFLTEKFEGGRHELRTQMLDKDE